MQRTLLAGLLFTGVLVGACGSKTSVTLYRGTAGLDERAVARTSSLVTCSALARGLCMQDHENEKEYSCFGGDARGEVVTCAHKTAPSPSAAASSGGTTPQPPPTFAILRASKGDRTRFQISRGRARTIRVFGNLPGDAAEVRCKFWRDEPQKQHLELLKTQVDGKCEYAVDEKATVLLEVETLKDGQYYVTTD